MNIQKTIAILISASALQVTVLHAQTNLFRVKFHAVCKPSDQGHDSTMNNADLIRQCVGTGFTTKELKRDFVVVYNADADSIQVVSRTNGEPVCDVFQFQGGTVVTNGDRLERLTFVFAPEQADAIGSAVIRERATTTGSNDVTRVRINGKIQFAMPDLLSIETESTASSDNSGTNQFSFAPADNNTTNSAISGDNITSNNITSNIITSITSITNDVSGIDTNATDNAGDNSGVEAPRFLAASADVAPTNSNVQVCRGEFTAGKEFIPSEADESDNNEDNTGTQESPTPDTGNTGTIDTGTTNSVTTTNTTTTVVTTNSTTVITNLFPIMTGI